VNVVPITVEDTWYSLQNLTPGASYQVQLFTEYDGKESIAYTSRNFTTSKQNRYACSLLSNTTNSYFDVSLSAHSEAKESISPGLSK
jgi:hypothetical protein